MGVGGGGGGGGGGGVGMLIIYASCLDQQHQQIDDTISNVIQQDNIGTLIEGEGEKYLEQQLQQQMSCVQPTWMTHNVRTFVGG